MQAYRAIAGGLIPADRAPPSYSLVAELARLSDEERRLAFDEGLISPNVTRTAIVAFRRRVRSSAADDAEAELARLLAQRERIEQRIRELQLSRCIIDAEAENP